MDIEKTCAFTGHRDLDGGIVVDDIKDIVKNIYESGYDTFLCGMARGFDLLAAEAVISLKKQLKNIKLIACVPCPDQDRYFDKNDKLKYAETLDYCDEIIILSDSYYKGCMLVRDRYMVDNCSLLVAYERKHEGGAFYTLNYAIKKNKEIIRV